ncbi:MAG: hypothetical protein J3K34DRAFT_458660 [Monoraphidium minutum]|nr:MAG: hypothetical protein J3K34DRAFT_458660 [Monoraphidium minutum]
MRQGDAMDEIRPACKSDSGTDSLSRVSVATRAGGSAPPTPFADDEGRWCAAGAACAARGGARIHPITLRIAPGELERQFWAGGGAPALSDGGALAGAALGSYMAWRATLVIAAPSVQRALAASLAALLLLAAAPAAAPRRWAAARRGAAAAQRVAQAAWVLAWLLALGTDEWHALLLRRHGGALHALALPEVLAIWALLPAAHALLWPLAFRLEAPLQAALCAAGCRSLAALACAARRDAALAAQARRVCRLAQLLKQLALSAGGAVGSAAPVAAACAGAPMETLLPLASALGCLGSLYISYLRELALKTDLIRAAAAAAAAAVAAAAAEDAPCRSDGSSSDGGATGGTAGGGGCSSCEGAACAGGVGGLWPAHASPVFHLLAVLFILLTCFAIAEAAASWGPHYAC